MEVTHDCVDLETAKLLKDKGFDCKVSSYYSAPTEYKPELTIDRVFDNKKLALVNWNQEDDFPWLFYSAPEHWMVIKWLRQRYNLHINIVTCNNNVEYTWHVRIGDKHESYMPNWEDAHHIYNDTPEEAELEAIKYCLNNLIDGK